MTPASPLMPSDIPAPYRAIGVHPGQDVWIFGYGSLMWNPGFPFQEKHLALVRGWHRAFCVYSIRHRGCRARPGAVLGLDRGGACWGTIYRVAAADAAAALRYLWDREMDGEVYQLRLLRAAWSALGPGAGPGTDGARRSVAAVAFTVRREHEQYCGRLPPDRLAGLIRHSVGESGPNIDYLCNTVTLLRSLGIHDQGLEGLMARVRDDAAVTDGGPGAG